MNNDVTIDIATKRVMIRSRGQWITGDAENFLADMLKVQAWTRTMDQQITILADLTELIVHTSEVAQKLEGAVRIIRALPIRKYALVVPSPVMKMQARRLLSGVPHDYFSDMAAARNWLGWEHPDQPDQRSAKSLETSRYGAGTRLSVDSMRHASGT